MSQINKNRLSFGLLFFVVFFLIGIWPLFKENDYRLWSLIISIIFFSKKTKINFFKFADIVSCVAPIGIFLGRIANFINGELYGKISTLPWAVVFPNGGNISRHPSQIYEAFLEGILLFFLINFLTSSWSTLISSRHVPIIDISALSILFIQSFGQPDTLNLNLYGNAGL